MTKPIKCLLLLLVITSTVEAKVIGVIGDTFPVAELSFLTLIETRLKALQDPNTLEQDWVSHVEQQAIRPTPVALSRALTTKAHRYHPEIILKNAIADNERHVLFPTGTRVNALQQLPSYKPHWLFFNGDDNAQRLWAKEKLNQDSVAKVILTGGSVLETEKRLAHEIYFDQGGFITRQLTITALPCEVIREQNHLLIREVAILENGHAR